MKAEKSVRRALEVQEDDGGLNWDNVYPMPSTRH